MKFIFKRLGSDPKYERWRWQVFAVTWLAYAGFYLTRKSFAVAKVSLAKPEVLGIDMGEMAWIDGVYLAAYAMGQFVWGMCGDRFGTRRVVLAGMLASVLTAVVMGASSLVVMLGMLLCFQGVCQSTGWAPLSKNISNFFSRRERGRAMGFWATNYAVGGVIASALAGYSIEWMGQNRLAEYQTEEKPTLAHVQRVAADQGFDEKTGKIIHGYLLISKAAEPPVKENSAPEVEQRLQGTRAACLGFLRDDQLNPLVRAAALRALSALREPDFDAALLLALRSQNGELLKAGQMALKTAIKSEVPEHQLSAMKTIRAMLLSEETELRQMGFDIVLKLPVSAQRQLALHIAGESSDPDLKQLIARLKIQSETDSRTTKQEIPPVFDPGKTMNDIHQNSLHIIWGVLAWRYAFWVPAGVLLGIWLLFILMQRNRPEDVGLPSIEEYHGEEKAVLTGNTEKEEAAEGSWQLIWQVMTNRMVLLLSGVYFFLKPTRYLILLWSPLYVSEKLGTGVAESGILGNMFEMAGPLGVLLGGFLSDKVFATRRMPAAVIGLFVVAAILFAFNSLPSTPWALGLGFFGIGFFLYMPDSLVSGTAAIDFGTRQGAGTASGMINGFGSIGAILGGILPGLLIGALGSDTDIWLYVFPILAVSILIAGVLLLPQWNRLPESVSRPETP